MISYNLHSSVQVLEGVDSDPGKALLFVATTGEGGWEEHGKLKVDPTSTVIRVLEMKSCNLNMMIFK